MFLNHRSFHRLRSLSLKEPLKDLCSWLTLPTCLFKANILSACIVQVFHFTLFKARKHLCYCHVISGVVTRGTVLDRDGFFVCLVSMSYVTVLNSALRALKFIRALSALPLRWPSQNLNKPLALSCGLHRRGLDCDCAQCTLHARTKSCERNGLVQLRL